MDSIIARPTNSVRVMVGAASGCWAIEVNAVATARPWLMAGPKQPNPMVTPAVMMEAMAMTDVLSILLPYGVESNRPRHLRWLPRYTPWPARRRYRPEPC